MAGHPPPTQERRQPGLAGMKGQSRPSGSAQARPLETTDIPQDASTLAVVQRIEEVLHGAGLLGHRRMECQFLLGNLPIDGWLIGRCLFRAKTGELRPFLNPAHQKMGLVYP